MRSNVIPAQITTVEDKIAGNLNLTQILILLIPLFWSALVYSLFIPSMRLVWYKVPLMVIVLLICLILSLRIKGTVVVNWLIILLTYNLRPRYYVFDKNDTYLRTSNIPFSHENKAQSHTDEIAIAADMSPVPQVSEHKLIWFENFLKNPGSSIRYKARKGGLNVSIEQIT